MKTVLPPSIEVTSASLTLTATNVFEAQKLWKARNTILSALVADGAEFQTAELNIIVGQRLYATITG